MKKSAYYSDLFFAFSLSAFCALFLLRFWGVKLLIAIFPSLAFGLLCSALLAMKLRKKQKVFALKKSEEEEKERLFFYLRLAERDEAIDFLQARLPYLTADLKRNQHAEPLSTPSGVIEYDGFQFFPRFSFSELTPDDIANAVKLLRALPNPVLLCDKLSETAQGLCEKLDLQVIQGNELYRKFKDANCLPEEFPLKLLPQKRLSRRAVCFAKSNSKRFFKSGILLSACSFFTPFSIYYAVAAFVFFAVAALVRIFGYR